MERKSFWVRVKVHREDLAIKVASKIAETVRLAVQVVPVEEVDYLIDKSTTLKLTD